MPKPIISLITDFGQNQHFVGEMKGVILKINPDARIIDLTHNIPPFDIVTASYILQNAIHYLPVPTIIVVVVDPGVGSARRPILAVGERHYYICPDNGVISRVIKEDNISHVYHVNMEHYMLKRRCETFHGRDVFAPVSAYLSKYFNAPIFGDLIDDYVTIDFKRPAIVGERTIKCDVIQIDHFGNLVTNLDRSMFEIAAKRFGNNKIRLKIGDTIINGLKSHYFDVPNKNDPLALFGSLDLLEISVREGNAADHLHVACGDVVYIQFSKS